MTVDRAREGIPACSSKRAARRRRHGLGVRGGGQDPMTSTATDETAVRERARHPARSVIIAVLTGLAVIAQAHAAEIPLDAFYPKTFVREPEPVRQTVVTVHKSRTIQVAQPFAKAIVADGTIADALPMTNQMLYIQGKRVGTTTVSLFDEQG